MKSLRLAAALAVCCSTAAAVTLYQPAVQVGTIASSQISEASGIAASRLNPGILWTHNDSGDSARIFAISTGGELRATVSFTGVTASDFEDIAVGPGPAAGSSYVYVGDIGDNNADKPSIQVHRLLEPPVSLSGPAGSGSLSVDTFTFVYPSGLSHDAESLMVDPLNGDIYIVTKEASAARVFRAAYPQSTTSTITLQSVGILAGIDHATAGDISPDGTAIAIRNGSQAWQWARAPGSTIAASLMTAPTPIPLVFEPQGEALGFAAFGPRGFYTTSEGDHQPIFFYQQVPEPAGFGLLCIAALTLKRNRRPGILPGWPIRTSFPPK